ncbi:MAG: hypothetical protein IJ568_02405 [Bacilli bacterium]|nr:hypothetical protein [Bacilli bacterium]
MIKKIIFLFLLILLTGCTPYSDINNLAIINKIAIEKDNNYKIHIEILNSLDNNNIISIEGETLEECMNNLNNKLQKRVYLTHLETLIITDSLKKENYKEIINYFLNNETSRNSFFVIATDKINDKILNIKSEDLENLIKISIETNGLVDKKTMDDVIKDILNYSNSNIPFINSNTLEIEGYKTIYESNKKLTKEDSIAFNFFQNKIKNINLLINNKSYKLENCNTTFKVKNNDIYFNTVCNYENNTTDLNIITEYLTNILNNYVLKNDNNYFYYLRNKYKKTNKKISVYTKIKIKEIERKKRDQFD